jgi:hypothetical protein
MKVKRPLVHLAVIVFVAPFFCSCASPALHLTAERPRYEAFQTVLNREPSTLNIPIESSTDELARILNQTIRTELYKGSTKARGLAANVVRNGSIIVTAADNFLYVTLPLNLALSFGMFETPTIPLRMKFRVTATITSDWRLHTEINYQGLSDLLAEDLRIGLFTFKPRSIVEGITQPVQQILSDLIAQKINEVLPLKAQITKVWNSAQKPILLDRSFSAWLTLTPQAVLLYPLTTVNNSIKMSVGISSIAELVVGPEPSVRALLPLPDLTLVTSFDKSFHIALNVDLFFKELRTIASTRLLNKTFVSDGKSVTIKDFDLYGNGDKLVVKLETLGSLAGVFYLTAKPVFNPQTNMFSVDEVDFDMQSQNLLHLSADWFLHGTIRTLIQEKLNMDVTKRLEQSRAMAGKALASVQLADHIFLKGDIKNLTFNTVIVQQDKISIRISTDGESAIFFK